MWGLKKTYLKILRIEMEELETDLQHLADEFRENASSRCLSENVVMQNLATLRNELLGVGTFERIIEHIQPEEFGSLDEMIDFLKSAFRQKMISSGLAEAVWYLVERKLEKVSTYVRQMDEATPFSSRTKPESNLKITNGH